MNKIPKFIDVTFAPGRMACFILQHNGKFYTCFNLPCPENILSISVETVSEVISDYREIITIKVYN